MRLPRLSQGEEKEGMEREDQQSKEEANWQRNAEQRISRASKYKQKKKKKEELE